MIYKTIERYSDFEFHDSPITEIRFATEKKQISFIIQDFDDQSQTYFDYSLDFIGVEKLQFSDSSFFKSDEVADVEIEEGEKKVSSKLILIGGQGSVYCEILIESKELRFKFEGKSDY